MTTHIFHVTGYVTCINSFKLIVSYLLSIIYNIIKRNERNENLGYICSETFEILNSLT